VTDDDHRPLLGVDHPLGGLDIAGERGERHLDRDHAVAVALEERDHALPARAVGEGAVDEHDRRPGGVPGGGAGASLRRRTRSHVGLGRGRGLGMQQAGAGEARGEHAGQSGETGDGHGRALLRALTGPA
jgi:hypothetical protein